MNAKEKTITNTKVKLFKVTVSLSIISMFLVTKWWFAIPVDGPDKLYWGFPFACIGEGFHTSMSFQIFLLEFFTNISIYFIFYWLLLFILLKKNPNLLSYTKINTIILTLALILSISYITYISVSNPMYHLKRDYDWRIIKTGSVFIWNETPRPEISLIEK